MAVRHYELLCLYRAELSDDDLKSVIDESRKVVTEVGAEVLSEDLWGKRRLAYEIEKKREGVYALFNLNAPPELDGAFREFARTDRRILRHMLTQTPKQKFLEDERAAEAQKEREAEAARREEQRRREEEARAEQRAAKEAAAEEQREREAAEAEAAASSVPEDAETMPTMEPVESSINEEQESGTSES